MSVAFYATIGKPYDYAVSRLEAAGGDFMALPLPLQTLLLVEAAQGIIDTGGLDFFYEADFPHHPPYSAFVDAYRRIGADDAASCIEATALMFPFADPEYFEPLRQVWLERLREAPDQAFAGFNQRISNDDSVWTQLSRYVEDHADAFRAA